MSGNFNFDSTFKQFDHSQSREGDLSLSYKDKNEVVNRYLNRVGANHASSGPSFISVLRSIVSPSSYALKDLRVSLVSKQQAKFNESLENFCNSFTPPIKGYRKLLIAHYFSQNFAKQDHSLDSVQNALKPFGFGSISKAGSEKAATALAVVAKQAWVLKNCFSHSITDVYNKSVQPKPSSDSLEHTHENRSEFTLSIQEEALKEAFADELKAPASTSLPELLVRSIKSSKSQLVNFTLSHFPQKIQGQKGVETQLLKAALECGDSGIVQLLINQAVERKDSKARSELQSTLPDLIKTLASEEKWEQIKLLAIVGGSKLQQINCSPYQAVFSSSLKPEHSKKLCYELIKVGCKLPDTDQATAWKELKLPSGGVGWCTQKNDECVPLSTRELLVAKALGMLDQPGLVLTSIDRKDYQIIKDAADLKSAVQKQDPLLYAFLDSSARSSDKATYHDFTLLNQWHLGAGLGKMNEGQISLLGKRLANALYQQTQASQSLASIEPGKLRQHNESINKLTSLCLGENTNPILRNSFISTWNGYQLQEIAKQGIKGSITCGVDQTGQLLIFNERSASSTSSHKPLLKLIQNQAEQALAAFAHLNPAQVLQRLGGIGLSQIEGSLELYKVKVKDLLKNALISKNYEFAAQVVEQAARVGVSWSSEDLYKMQADLPKNAADVNRWNAALVTAFANNQDLPKLAEAPECKLRSAKAPLDNLLFLWPRGDKQGSVESTQHVLMALFANSQGRDSEQGIGKSIDDLRKLDKKIDAGMPTSLDQVELANRADSATNASQSFFMKNFSFELASNDFAAATSYYAKALCNLPNSPLSFSQCQKEMGTHLSLLKGDQKQKWNTHLIQSFSALAAKEPTINQELKIGIDPHSGLLILQRRGTSTHDKNALISSLVQVALECPFEELHSILHTIATILLSNKKSMQTSFAVLAASVDSRAKSALNGEQSEALALLERSKPILNMLNHIRFSMPAMDKGDNTPLARASSSLRLSLAELQEQRGGRIRDMQAQFDEIGAAYADLLVQHWNEKFLSNEEKTQLEDRRQSLLERIKKMGKKAAEASLEMPKVGSFTAFLRLSKQLQETLENGLQPKFTVSAKYTKTYEMLCKLKFPEKPGFDIQNAVRALSEEEMRAGIYECSRQALFDQEFNNRASWNPATVFLYDNELNTYALLKETAAASSQGKPLGADICFSQIAVLAKNAFARTETRIMELLPKQLESNKKGLENTSDKMEAISTYLNRPDVSKYLNNLKSVGQAHKQAIGKLPELFTLMQSYKDAIQPIVELNNEPIRAVIEQVLALDATSPLANEEERLVRAGKVIKDYFEKINDNIYAAATAWSNVAGLAIDQVIKDAKKVEESDLYLRPKFNMGGGFGLLVGLNNSIQSPGGRQEIFDKLEEFHMAHYKMLKKKEQQDVSSAPALATTYSTKESRSISDVELEDATSGISTTQELSITQSLRKDSLSSDDVSIDISDMH